MDASLGLNDFTILFLGGTFFAALVDGLGGFAGIYAEPTADDTSDRTTFAAATFCTSSSVHSG